MKPIYDKVAKSSQSWKGIYLTYRNKRATQSKGSFADNNETKEQSRELQANQELTLASKRHDRGKVSGLMEVGLWSSHGGDTAITTQTDDNIVDDQAWPYSPNTSYLLV